MVSNLTILISCSVVGRLRLALNHSVLLDFVGVFRPTLICLEGRKWVSMIGSLRDNQVAVGLIHFVQELGLCFFSRLNYEKLKSCDVLLYNLKASRGNIYYVQVFFKHLKHEVV